MVKIMRTKNRLVADEVKYFRPGFINYPIKRLQREGFRHEVLISPTPSEINGYVDFFKPSHCGNKFLYYQRIVSKNLLRLELLV
jgi:hypothetical protein